MSTIWRDCNVHLAMQTLEGKAGKAGCDKRYDMSTPFGGDQSVGCAAVLLLCVHGASLVCAAREGDVQCDCLACNVAM